MLIALLVASGVAVLFLLPPEIGKTIVTVIIAFGVFRPFLDKWLYKIFYRQGRSYFSDGQRISMI